MENMNKIPSEPCEICGDIGIEDSIMTCFNCRVVREHIYCARIRLRSVPDMWLCQVCRSSTRVLLISNLVDNDTKSLKTDNAAGKSSYNSVQEEISLPVLNQRISNGGSGLSSPSHGLMLMAHSSPDKDKGASLVSNDTSQNKKQRQHFIAFPSPKRKRRTLRLPGVM